MVRYSQALAKLGNRPGRLIWCASIFIGLVLTLELGGYFFRKQELHISRNILIANKDLVAGTKVTLADLDVQSFSEAQLGREERFMTDQDLFSIQDKVLVRSIEKGQPLLINYFWKDEKNRDFIKIPRGKRAFFLETDSLYWVHPGVSVDVVLNTIEDKKGTPIIIENALVLSVEMEQQRSGVTVALSPEEIDLLQPKLHLGKIGLAVRNPEDKVRGRASKKAKQLFPKRVKVELITEE